MGIDQTGRHRFYHPIKLVVRSESPTFVIADVVVQDLRPAAIVEGRGFEALLRYIEPGFKVPSATHIVQVVCRKHEGSSRRS